jgi:hypothetical protein
VPATLSWRLFGPKSVPVFASRRTGLGPVAAPRQAILPAIIRSAVGTARENLSHPGQTHILRPITRTFRDGTKSPSSSRRKALQASRPHEAARNPPEPSGRPYRAPWGLQWPSSWPWTRHEGTSRLTSRLVCCPVTAPARPSFPPSTGLLHRHQDDPVTVPEQHSQGRRRGASLRAWAVLRYSGPVP